MTKEMPLAGKGILVTRPAQQAERLASLIRARGGDPILFPAIEIRDLENPEALDAIIERLDEFELAVFVSPSAVDKAMSRIAARRELPAGLTLAAIGPGSMKVLARFGAHRVIAPASRHDSEGLLALPQLAQMGGKRVIVFRGEGGRELLAETLHARGALVEYAQCYRRARPAIDAAPLLAAARGGRLAAITVTSSEGVRNLFQMAGEEGRALLQQTPCFVTHTRIAQAARELAVVTVIVTESGDEGLIAGLVEYFG